MTLTDYLLLTITAVASFAAWQFRQFAAALVLDFVKTRVDYVSVSLRPAGHLHFVSTNGTTTDQGWCPFDGAAVPPEILKAIRRVAR